MRGVLLMMVLTCVCGCAVDPAHMQCERRLVPINATEAGEVKGARKGKAVLRATKRGSAPAVVQE